MSTDKSAAAARELVERWMGKKHPITMRSYVSDLTALISEGYYPKEFVEWKDKNVMRCYGGWMFNYGHTIEPRFKSNDELFNYWEENER